MSFLIGLLTVVLVLDCVLLILLVLIQLPKKEAGAGVAFGGAATDALFGAGTGNVLTKVTKWAVVIFFVLALLLGYLQDKLHRGRGTTDFEKQLQQKQMEMQPISTPQPITPPAAVPGTPPISQPAAVPPSASTNLPEAPAQSK